MRKAILPALLCLLLICTAGIAGAENPPGNLPIIQDDADLLTAEEEAALYERMLPVCDYGTPMFWTTLEAGDYETLAKNFYVRKLGGGVSGTVFVINMRSRQLTVMSDGAIFRTVTRADAESITDNVFRLAGRGEYYECAARVFDQIAGMLAGEKIARPMKTASNALLALVLALLGVYLYISRRYETRAKNGAGSAAVPLTAAAAAAVTLVTANNKTRLVQRKRTEISSGSGSGGSHGGGFSGGGGGGGGFSGGGGSHGF